MKTARTELIEDVVRLLQSVRLRHPTGTYREGNRAAVRLEWVRKKDIRLREVWSLELTVTPFAPAESLDPEVEAIRRRLSTEELTNREPTRRAAAERELQRLDWPRLGPDDLLGLRFLLNRGTSDAPIYTLPV